ncbi:hypothetical protein [Prosthecobacter sp.]|uniref:hypothetical protein n=1 Tax=Prosthecobacter sp. TaxID=1965333 RepID=UPI003782E49A
MKTRTFTFLLLFLSLGALALPRAMAAEPTSVSLIQLIANPKAYDGARVRVIGFLNVQFEGNAIYLHEDDFKHGIHKNGLWVDASSIHPGLKQKYVLIEGTFDAKMTGHMGLWSGSIQQITRSEAWR